MINMHLRIWLMPQKAMKTFCRQPDLMTDIQPTSTPVFIKDLKIAPHNGKN